MAGAWIASLWPQAILVCLLSVLIPLSIFVGRSHVRLRRLQLLDHLAEVLPSAAGRSRMPGAFTLMRARYAAASGRRELGVYALPTAVFAAVSACGFALLLHLGGEWLAAAKILLVGLHVDGGSDPDFGLSTGLVMAAGFIGAYIWSINYLILRVANFDLSPLSFLRTSAHILLTVFVAWVLRQVLAAPLPDAVAVAVLLGITFLSGIYPTLGLNVLVDRLPTWLRFKRDVPEGAEIGRSFPLDLLDGIDPSIKFRLNELDIQDVQNLATANPVELFVETPYSFTQVVDWMAQAQLLAELGPQRFLKARASGVRDMATFGGLAGSEAGRQFLGRLLAVDGATEEVVEAWLAGVATKPHIRELGAWCGLLSCSLDPQPSARAVP